MFKITLRAARINAGLSQAEAAKAVGISSRTLGDWEREKTQPRLNMLIKLCALYKTPIDLIILPEQFS